VAQPDTATFLLVLPMALVLIVAVFRLDELFGRPAGQPKPGRRLSSWDKNGVPICADPARIDCTIARRKY
jgi:hypothetical protein